MAKPTVETRRAVALRDGYRCVLCGTLENPTFQHRRATGMGGSKIVPAPTDGCVLDILCNQLIEQDAHWATLARAYGVKLPRWVNSPERVPIYYPHEMEWYRLDGVYRVKITAMVAHELMYAQYGPQWLQWFQEAKS